jgi:hypothetical protein
MNEFVLAEPLKFRNKRLLLQMPHPVEPGSLHFF